MTEVRGEPWQQGGNVRICAIGVGQGPYGEAVPEVMQARSAGSRARHETGLTDQLLEDALDGAVQQPGAGCGDEQTRRLRLAAQT